MSTLEQGARLARTVRLLRPAQVVHRMRLRAQQQVLARLPDQAERVLRSGPVLAVGWPEDFISLDCRDPTLWPDPDLLANGRVLLLGRERAIENWRDPDAPQLWRYHLHYWDWAWALVQDEDRLRARATFRRLFRSWQTSTRFGRWDEWSPYVVSLRAWSWCGQFDTMVRDSDFEQEMVDLLALHARFLRVHLELDVGGNHLVKNLKALVGLGVFLGDGALKRHALERLRRAVRRQVLGDGGHEERAPAYHCQVLGDLLDVRDIMGQDAPAWLSDAVRRMQKWLGRVLLPDGTVPLLNDGFPVPRALLQLLDPGPPAAEGLTVLPDSGLAVLRRGPWHVLADVGPPCPDDLPAHAHADSLGFLLYCRERRLVGESFTSTYAPGPVRDAERGTAAHSTVQVDGQDSTEVYGGFRAGRRARVLVQRAEDDGEHLWLTASHDGYRHLSGRPVHRRTWALSVEGLQISDELLGGGDHEVALRFHVAPGVRGRSTVPLECVATLAAYGWHDCRDSPVLEYVSRVALPWRAGTALTEEQA